MECPKCHYVRKQDDHTPDWQCPSCGIAYSKYQADTSNQASKQKFSSSSRDRQEVKSKSSGISFKGLRVFILVVILLLVGLDAWFTKMRTTDWDHPLRVVVYPINVEDTESNKEYIASLSVEDYDSVDQFMLREAKSYGLPVKDPVDFKLGPEINNMPPLPPEDRNILKVMLWSLKLRYWAYSVDTYDGPTPDIRVFALFHDPELNSRLQHSTGLEKGMLSLVHAFADEGMAEKNNVVVAHELLHTLGATDKYDLTNGQPIFPDGYADPEQEPLYPQVIAEIMGAKIPVSETETVMPRSLKYTIIGAKTGQEIGWLD